jgi:hypothetical protein
MLPGAGGGQSQMSTSCSDRLSQACNFKLVMKHTRLLLSCQGGDGEGVPCSDAVMSKVLFLQTSPLLWYVISGRVLPGLKLVAQLVQRQLAAVTN